jgi:hypothetical protein
MHGPIKFKSPHNSSKWQMGFNSALKGIREEHMLRVLKNRVLRKITGPNRKEITRQLHRISLSGASQFSFLNKYYLGDGINKNTLSGVCSLLWWKCEMHTMFWVRK